MDNYTIISENIGSGAIGKVYIIEKINPPSTKLIVKKFDNSERERYEKEKFILSKFSNSNESNNKYIIKLKNIYISIDELPYNSNYLLFDYLEYGNLNKYLENNYCFTDIPEIYAKLICYKLLKGLKTIHDNGICHNKMNEKNIMFDNEFNPIIIHFSEAYMNNDNIFRKDFQGLARIIAKLITSGKFMNIRLSKKYKYIVILDNAQREIKESEFWQNVEVKKEFIDFFNLLLKSKLPLNIDDLLNNIWLKDIKDIDNNNSDNTKKLKEIENNLKNDFGNIYLKILEFEKQNNKQIITDINSIINIENNTNEKNSLINNFIDTYKSSEITNEKSYMFNLEIRNINNKPEGILFDYLEIIINSNNDDYNKPKFFYYFMYNLKSNIDKFENLKKTFDNSEQYLSFNVSFEESKINEEIDDNDINKDKYVDKNDKNDNLLIDELIFDEDENENLEIKIELVKYNSINEIDNERYFLMFNYIQGETYDYYHYLNMIKKMAKELLNSEIKI